VFPNSKAFMSETMSRTLEQRSITVCRDTGAFRPETPNTYTQSKSRSGG